MVIQATVKGNKAIMLVNGKEIALKQDGKTESGLTRFSRAGAEGVYHVYAKGKTGHGTLKLAGKTGGGNPKFEVKSTDFKAFAIVPAKGHKLAVSF